MSKARRWARFLLERFEPITHTLLIATFVLAQALFAQRVLGTPVYMSTGLLGFATAFFFFFKLRCYDEIKDYELDVVINPGRPLPRGLLTHKDLHTGIAVCIFLELCTLGAFSVKALPALYMAVAYSLLMYKEFFIRDRIRPLLTTYAVSHTVVSAMLSLSLISAFAGELFWRLPSDAYWFALSTWPLFNVFEFGRKTFIPSEERQGVASYSKVFTRPGAVLLNVSQLALFCVALYQIPGLVAPFPINFFGGLLALFALVGAGMAFFPVPAMADAYRLFSNVVILLAYGGLIVHFYLMRG